MKWPLVVLVLPALLLSACGSRTASTPTTIPATGVTTTTVARPSTLIVAPTTVAAASTTTTTVVSITTTTLGSTTTNSVRAVLPPATVPPKGNECALQLSYGADGTVGPLTCSNGDLNTLAWTYYAAKHPLVMSLGPYATPGQVEQALCADESNNSIPIATDMYHLAADYYGWQFGVDPSLELVNGGCPAS